MPLTDRQCLNAPAVDKPYKLYDGNGLYLWVSPKGTKVWRYRYEFSGREKLISLGRFPDLGVRAARDERDRQRVKLIDGIDPSALRKLRRVLPASVEDSFEFVAREWHQRFSAQWTPSHAARNLRRLELYVFPLIGSMPVGKIEAADVLSVLERIVQRGTVETAHRVKFLCSGVMRYAVATSRAKTDPTGVLSRALPASKERHHAAITDPQKLATLLRSIDSYGGGLIVGAALRLAPLLFLRPGELRQLRWDWIDLDAPQPEARIPAEIMKMKRPLRVPLARQAVAILRSIAPFADRGCVFPGARRDGRSISGGTLIAALKSLGYHGDVMTMHGFRATARTLLDEVLGFDPDVIEEQLAHAKPGSLGMAYNRTQHWPQRIEMMQAWADYLDQIKHKSA
jgi:integrase